MRFLTKLFCRIVKLFPSGGGLYWLVQFIMGDIFMINFGLSIQAISESESSTNTAAGIICLILTFLSAVVILAKGLIGGSANNADYSEIWNDTHKVYLTQIIDIIFVLLVVTFAFSMPHAISEKMSLLTDSKTGEILSYNASGYSAICYGLLGVLVGPFAIGAGGLGPWNNNVVLKFSNGKLSPVGPTNDVKVEKIQIPDVKKSVLNKWTPAWSGIFNVIKNS